MQKRSKALSKPIAPVIEIEDEDDDMEEMSSGEGEESHSMETFVIGSDGAADIEIAEKVFARIQDYRNLAGLTVTIVEGRIHTKAKMELAKAKTNFLSLDFGAKTQARNILTFSATGQAFGRPLTFRAALGYSEPKSSGKQRGGGSLYLCITDRHRGSDDENARFKEFGIIGLVDRLVVSTSKSFRKTKVDVDDEDDDDDDDIFDDESDKNPKKSGRRGEDENDDKGKEEADDLASPHATKKAKPASEPDDIHESEKMDRSENSKIASEVINCMVWEDPKMIAEAGRVLRERYEPIMEVLVRQEIEDLAEEQDWEGQHRDEIKAAIARKAHAAMAAWTAKEKEKVKRANADLVAETRATWTTWAADETKKARVAFDVWKEEQQDKALEEAREAGRKDVALALTQKKLMDSKTKAAETPGLSEVDMSKPVSEFEKKQIESLFKKPTATDHSKKP